MSSVHTGALPVKLETKNADRSVNILSKAEDTWPESWKISFSYDAHEVFGQPGWTGYVNAYKDRQRATLEMVSEAVPPGGRILDVAAAQGNFTLILAEQGYDMVWNDLRAELADYVKLKHEKGSIEYCPGNVFDLGFEDAFDAVLITEIIEHVAHPDEFLSQIGRMVKPGGHIIMTTPNGAHLMNSLPRFSDCPNPEVFEDQQFKPNGDGHIFLLWPDEVKQMADKADLILEKHALFTTPWYNGRHKLEGLISIIPGRWMDSLESVAQWMPERIKSRLMIHSASLLRKPFGPASASVGALSSKAQAVSAPTASDVHADGEEMSQSRSGGKETGPGKMRILAICNVPLDPTLGSAYVILNYARHLRELGHDVRVVGPETFMSLPKLPVARLLRMAIGMRNYVRKHAMNGQFDVVELYGGHTCYAARLLAASEERECLVVAHTNGIEMHMDEAKERFGELTARSHLKSTLMPVRDAFTKVDGIVTVSQFDLAYAKRERLLPEARMLAIENPLPEGYVGTPLQLQRNQVIGYCGGWHPIKGVSYIEECMLELFMTHPHLKLKMIGVGKQFSKEKLFPQDLWDRIEVVPFVRDRTELKRHYEEISILLMPSVYESFGMVSTEGMACGCALVGTNTGFAASLKHGEEVMHVNLAEKNSMPRAISALLDDDELRQRIARNGWKRVQNLRWSEAARTLEATYGRWLAELRARRRHGAEIGRMIWTFISLHLFWCI